MYPYLISKSIFYAGTIFIGLGLILLIIYGLFSREKSKIPFYLTKIKIISYSFLELGMFNIFISGGTFLMEL